MSNLIIKEVNCETGEELEREMTAAEKKEFIALGEKLEQNAIAEKALLESAEQTLAKLGLTKEQLQALIG